MQNINLKFEHLKCDLSTQNLEFLGCWYSIFWKKESIVKHVSTQVNDNCKILIWNLSAWNVIWVLRIWNFLDVGTQYFEKKSQLWNMLVLRWMIIAKYQFEIWALEMWFEYSESGIFWMLVLNILKKRVNFETC